MSWKALGATQATTLRIDSAFLGAQLAALTGGTVRGPITFAAQMNTIGGRGALLERLCQVIVGEIDRGTPLDHPAVQPELPAVQHWECLGRG